MTQDLVLALQHTPMLKLFMDEATPRLNAVPHELRPILEQLALHALAFAKKHGG